MLTWTYLLLLTFKYVDTANYVLIFSFFSQQDRKITLRRRYYNLIHIFGINVFFSWTKESQFHYLKVNFTLKSLLSKEAKYNHV